jgi:CheY-like chemotaxis protein
VDGKANQERGRVLLIDDEQAVLDVTRMILEHFGFAVTTAQGGAEALDRIGQQPADVQIVILDLNMPDVQGAEVFRRIRDRRPDVPILFSSGYSANAVPPDLARQPNTGFLQKPYQASVLIGKVQELIGQAKRTDRP